MRHEEQDFFKQMFKTKCNSDIAHIGIQTSNVRSYEDWVEFTRNKRRGLVTVILLFILFFIISI